MGGQGLKNPLPLPVGRGDDKVGIDIKVGQRLCQSYIFIKIISSIDISFCCLGQDLFVHGSVLSILVVWPGLGPLSFDKCLH